MSLDYIAERMPLADWWPCLVIALECEEVENRRSYWGEPDQYVPLFAPDEAPTTQEERAARKVTGKILGFAGQMGARPMKGSLEQLSKMRPDKAQQVYVDKQGRVVDAEGNQVVVPEGMVVVDAAGQRLEAAESQAGQAMQLEDILAMFGVKPEGQG